MEEEEKHVPVRTNYWLLVSDEVNLVMACKCEIRELLAC